MIERNVGTPERIVRFLLAIAAAGWVLSSERLGLAQGAVLLAALALTWNSIFGRCYLWKWLGLSSCKSGDRCHSTCADNSQSGA